MKGNALVGIITLIHLTGAAIAIYYHTCDPSTHMLMADAIYAVINTSLAGLSRIIESKLNNHEDWAPVRRVPPAGLSPTDRVEEAPAVGPACIHWVADATSCRFWARRIGTAISSNNRRRGLRIDMRAISSG